jgi:hypothetical protein
MKCETARYVAKCDTCRRVKVDHMRPARLLQPLNIPAWIWEYISMDFIMHLPLSTCKFDSIWVIIDRFTKYAHFIPMHTNYRAEKYTKLYIAHIMYLHGVPKKRKHSNQPKPITHPIHSHPSTQREKQGRKTLS